MSLEEMLKVQVETLKEMKKFDFTKRVYYFIGGALVGGLITTLLYIKVIDTLTNLIIK